MSAAGQRRAVVTGAASGIGRAVARAPAGAKGLDVLAVDIDDEAASPRRAAAGCETMTADLGGPGGARPRRGRRRGHRLSRQCRRHHPAQADLRVHGRGLAPDLQPINAESIFFLCQAIGPRLRAGRRDRQSLVELGQARHHDRGRGLCRLEDDDPLDHPLLRLCAGRRGRCGSTRSAPASSIRRCRTRCWTTWRRCAASTADELERRRATRPCRSAARPRADECAGADLVPALRRGGLHDRPGDQFHRRPGDVVAAKGGRR